MAMTMMNNTTTWTNEGSTENASTIFENGDFFHVFQTLCAWRAEDRQHRLEWRAVPPGPQQHAPLICSDVASLLDARTAAGGWSGPSKVSGTADDAGAPSRVETVSAEDNNPGVPLPDVSVEPVASISDNSVAEDCACPSPLEFSHDVCVFVRWTYGEKRRSSSVSQTQLACRSISRVTTCLNSFSLSSACLLKSIVFHV